MSEIRLLQPSDIPAAMRLVEAADWNQTAADWDRLLRLAPSSCWGVFDDGELNATTTAYVYPNGVVWIGMVLTAPAARGRGYATALVQQALTTPAACFRLDATAQGAPLYRKFGFVDERAIERWERGPSSHGYHPALLNELADPGIGRPGRKAWYFGPWQGGGLEAALKSTVSRHEAEAIYWDLFPDDAEAVALASRHGFVRARQLVRMRLGPFVEPIAAARAICGFEWG